MGMQIYFISSNQYKIKEVEKILSSKDIEVLSHSEKIEEIQSDDIVKIVNDKAKKAYKIIQKPLIVEQTGLYLENIGDLPGGLTQIFWDKLGADKFCEFFSSQTSKATAKTIFAFCDGKKIYNFEGETEGIIVDEPRGERDFQWDCVFQPKGYAQTFAEMDKIEDKNEVSMRKKALVKFEEFLKENKYV